LIGFCPYFLHAHRSDGTTSPLVLGRPPTPGGAATGAGMHTTFFVWLFLYDTVHARNACIKSIRNVMQRNYVDAK
jgi:hypothetical protein